MENKQQDETMKERIISLLRKGYTRKQLINDFGFAERTVDAAIRAYRELNDGNVEGTKEGSKPSADDGASPTAKPKNSDKEPPDPHETVPWRFARKKNPCCQSGWKGMSL